jgi:hypothetical protein
MFRPLRRAAAVASAFDELDLIALYLATGFNIGDAEFGDTALMIYGMSERLNTYFERQQPGTPLRLPQAKRTPRWNAILQEVEKRASDGWLAVTQRLLNVSYDDQVKVDKHIAEAERLLARKSDPPAYAAMLANGPTRRREALAAVICGKMTREERFQFVREAAGSTMGMAGTNDCLVIGLDTRAAPAPFHLMALVRQEGAGHAGSRAGVTGYHPRRSDERRAAGGDLVNSGKLGKPLGRLTARGRRQEGGDCCRDERQSPQPLDRGRAAVKIS